MLNQFTPQVFYTLLQIELDIKSKNQSAVLS